MVPELDARLAAAAVVEVLDTRTAGTMQHRWRETYARQLKATHGVWCVDDFDWHVFSMQMATSVAAGVAEEAWRDVPDGEVIVVSSWTKAAPEGWILAHKPDMSGLNLDLTVFPRSLEWTMAFTHEADGSGPISRGWNGSQPSPSSVVDDDADAASSRDGQNHWP